MIFRDNFCGQKFEQYARTQATDDMEVRFFNAKSMTHTVACVNVCPKEYGHNLLRLTME